MARPTIGDLPARRPGWDELSSLSVMARYEYRCRTCDERFELRRAMSDADAPASCSAGHASAVRLLSVFASVGGASEATPVGAVPGPVGGCGTACGCHHC